MPKLIDLLKKLQLTSLPNNELKIALTHSSFYQESKDTKAAKDNSRYIFLGMFHFRGAVANMLYKYMPGTGTQLQHALGNIFANTKLETLFDTWDLQHHIRHDERFNAKKHKHIFVYGILGYVIAHFDSLTVDSFITRHIVDQSILQQYTGIKHNPRAQLNLLAIQKYNQAVKVKSEYIEEKYHITIKVKDTILAQHTSPSKEYATKKAIHKAIASFNFNVNDLPLTSENLDQKQANTQKHNEWLAKQKATKEAREQRMLQRAIEAEQKDKERRKAKALRKKKIEEVTKAAPKETKPINAGKRRYLEDKKK
jgi:dsRNA-specific ribonuclease